MYSKHTYSSLTTINSCKCFAPSETVLGGKQWITAPIKPAKHRGQLVFSMSHKVVFSFGYANEKYW